LPSSCPERITRLAGTKARAYYSSSSANVVVTFTSSSSCSLLGTDQITQRLSTLGPFRVNAGARRARHHHHHHHHHMIIISFLVAGTRAVKISSSVDALS
jgi:hypothetical protein